jgi:hypothetical protein
VELVVVVEVVGVVVVFLTVIVSFLDASPPGPGIFPSILALSDFAFRSNMFFICCSTNIWAATTGSVPAGGGFEGFISVCYCLIILPSWY